MFLVPRIVFSAEPTPQAISPAPGNPSLEPSYRLIVTATSLANGTVQLKARVPAAGKLAASATSALPASSSRVHKKKKRTVARASAPARGGTPVKLNLQLTGRYRGLALRAGGLRGTVTVTFSAKGHPTLRKTLVVHFVHRTAHRRHKQGPLMGCRIPLILLLALLAVALAATSAAAAPLADDGGAEWQVEQPLPPPPALGGVEPRKRPSRSATSATSSSTNPAEPRRADHLGQRRQRRTGRVVLQRRRLEGALQQNAARPTGASHGRARMSSGPSPTAAPGRRSRPAPNARRVKTTRSATSRQDRRATSKSSAPTPRCRSSAAPTRRCTPPRAWRRTTAGSVASRSRRRRSARSCSTGTASSLEPQPFLPEGHPVREMVPFEGHLDESMRIQPGDKFVDAIVASPRAAEDQAGSHGRRKLLRISRA